MKKTAAVKHFGSVIKLAAALGIARNSIYQWKETIPQGRAFQLHVLTKGKLKVSEKQK